MSATALASPADPLSLDSAALARRLAQLAGDERALQAEFLLHLEVFDSRRAWSEAGYPSLWEWCLRVLHLREGAAGRRIAAMRVLRRFPELAEELRQGRLCLSTVALLGPVLTAENVAEIVERAAFLTKAEVERLVVTLAPRTPPRDGVRRIATTRADPEPADVGRPSPESARSPAVQPTADLFAARAEPARGPATAPPLDAIDESARRSNVRPVDAERYSVRLTDLVRSAAFAEPEDGKRRGEGDRPGRAAIPTAVRREVWKRDGGRCAWQSPAGRRCGSTWKLEIDHVQPVALGGPSTVDNLRLACRAHNQLHADETFGCELMDLRRASPRRAGPRTSPGESGSLTA